MAGYLPAAAAERAAQYAALGLSGPEALYRDVPESVRLTAPLNLPPPQSELEARRTLEALAEQNLRFRTILRGAGAYDHYIPAAVSRIASKEEFVTAYTPYQAEISQGVLQSIFEFQTMICELTGLDADNASVYDGASAAAEAGARFVYPAFGMTLRDQQREYYYQALEKGFPGLAERYQRHYGPRYECPSPRAKALWAALEERCRALGLLCRMRDITAAYQRGYGERQLTFF